MSGSGTKAAQKIKKEDTDKVEKSKIKRETEKNLAKFKIINVKLMLFPIFFFPVLSARRLGCDFGLKQPPIFFSS